MAWGEWWGDKVLESRGLQASHTLGEEVDQPELKTDPEGGLDFTNYILSHYLEGVLSRARNMVTEPLFKTPLGTGK